MNQKVKANLESKPVVDFKAASEQALAAGREAARQSEDAVRQGIDHAESAFSSSSDYAYENVEAFGAAAEAFRNHAADFQRRSLEIALGNMNAGFEFTRRLMSVREPQAAAELTRSFAAEQFQAFARQSAELNALAVQIASESARPVHATWLKSFDDVKKAFNV